MRKRIVILIIGLSFVSTICLSQYKTLYPDIPRIDVHVHAHDIIYPKDSEGSRGNPHFALSPNYSTITNYLTIRKRIIKNSGADLALWINLGGDRGIDTTNEVSKGRMMTCLSDYVLNKKMYYNPEDLSVWLKKGYVGYKLWFAPFQRRSVDGKDIIKYVDDKEADATFSAMGKAGLPAASLHIADPNGPYGNRGEWCSDPVEFWRMIIGLERVLQRHQDLVMVVAHCAWLICQDAQIDFLRYLLSTYPNMYVDLSATDQYYHLVDQKNLRDFFINYSDRIIFGTDLTGVKESEIDTIAARYVYSFKILETNDLVERSFFGDTPVNGLGLPRDVLEKIYYKNALKVYPGLSERMQSLGYTLNK